MVKILLGMSQIPTPIMLRMLLPRLFVHCIPLVLQAILSNMFNRIKGVFSGRRGAELSTLLES